jgi:small redox-active disulfide protein 2
MKITIYGMGCPRCRQLEREVVNALAELDIAADVEHEKDINRIAQAGVLATPGLAVDDRVVSTGAIPSRAELIKLLTGSG